MGRADGRIEAGQRINKAISARAWNRAQEAADLVLGVNGQVMPGSAASQPFRVTVVMMRNDSGSQVPACGVLACDQTQGVVNPPEGGSLSGTDIYASKALQFFKAPVLRGIAPTNNTVSNVFVAMEPVAVNAVGRFACSGVFACKVKVVNANHKYARGRVGDVTQLVTTGCGPVKILWRELSSGDNVWALGVM